MKKSLIYRISHDTKQHVNQIITISELLSERSKSLSEDDKKYLQWMTDAGREMKAVIEALAREAAETEGDDDGAILVNHAVKAPLDRSSFPAVLDPSSKLMLVTEDDEDDFMLLKEIFEENSSNLALQWAKDGEEALDYLSKRGAFSASPRPALVLLDLNMPKVDGIEVLKQIRSREEWRHIPVAIFTNSMNQKEALEAYRAGANAFIRKPSGYKELQDFSKTFIRYWFEYSTLV